MEIVFLALAGFPVSLVHAYLVWKHRANRKYSISEHAIIDRQSHMLYVVTHIFTVVFYTLYSYKFFIVKHDLVLPFVLNMVFAVLDLMQAIVPSRGKTGKLHIGAAYISWVCYVVSGLIALFSLHIAEPFRTLASALMVPVIGMFVYMHINRTKLYPYQLLVVPMYVVVMLLVSIGS